MKSIIIFVISYFVISLVFSCKQDRKTLHSSIKQEQKDKVSDSLIKKETLFFYIHKDGYFPDKTKIIETSFNSEIYINDTIKSFYFEGIESFLVKSKKFDSIWSGNLSPFKFPNANGIYNCSEKSNDPMDCLFEYFTNTLNWKRNKDFFEDREYDEETFYFKKGFMFNNNKISFWTAVQLIKQIYNLSNNNLKQDFIRSDESNIWMAYSKESFFRVINYNNTIQFIVENSSINNVNEYQKIKDKTIKSIKNKDYKSSFWYGELSMDRNWDFILSVN